MAADLHIHVFEGIAESDLRAFFSNTLGSKYFAPRTLRNTYEGTYEKISHTPNVWIGEVSWLKAALSGDSESYVPNPVGNVHDIIGENLPVLTEALRDDILAALSLDNATRYSVVDKADVATFLEAHMGKRLFTVSW